MATRNWLEITWFCRGDARKGLGRGKVCQTYGAENVCSRAGLFRGSLPCAMRHTTRKNLTLVESNQVINLLSKPFTRLS